MEQSSSIFSFRVFRTPVILISLCLIWEIGFRIFSFGIHAAFNWKNYNPQGILLTDIVMPVDNAEISWKLRPDVETIFKAQVFTTNSLGLRNSEIALNKPVDKIRVAVLGRSITLGAGVADHEVYTRVLQDHLNSWKPESYEIINCAVGGYSLNQMVNYYDNYIARLNPDLILIPLSKDELTKSQRQNTPALSEAKPSLTNLGHYLSYTFLYESLRFVVRRSTNTRISTDWKMRASQAISNKTEESSATLNNKELLAEFIAQRHQEAVTCYIFSPDRGKNSNPRRNENLKKWTAQVPGVSYLAVNEYVQDKIPENTHIYFGDNHLNPEMHGLIAEALFNQFKTGKMEE